MVMNERIRELAQQAGIHPTNFEPDADLSVPLTVFAELIVRECADFVDNAISDGGVDGRSLKEHFGVE